MTWSNRSASKFALGALLAIAGTETASELLPLSSLGMISEAQARVGRPLTPVSVAGVARRTTRRVVRRSTYYYATLPAGCPLIYVDSSPYWYCGGSYYQKSGTQYVIVYIDD